MGFIRGLFKTLIVLLLLLIAGGLLLPASTTVTRSIQVDAAPEKVFALVNGFVHFNRFSPWHNIDPLTQYSYSGPRSGVGARMQWASEHPNVGVGSIQVIEVERNRRVTSRLAFEGQGTAVTWFALQPAGDSTEVSWGLRSDTGYDLVARYFNLLLDYFAGKSYEQGLRQLKILAEATPDTPTNGAAADAGQGVYLRLQPAASQLRFSSRSAADIDAITAAVSRAYNQLQAASRAGGVNANGAPAIVEDDWTPDGYHFTAALPVSGGLQDTLPSGIEWRQQPEQPLACAVNTDAARRDETYQQVLHWIHDNGYLVTGASRVETVPSAQNGGSVTQVCFPVATGNG